MNRLNETEKYVEVLLESQGLFFCNVDSRCLIYIALNKASIISQNLFLYFSQLFHRY